ncbi:hypothetical protein Tco_0837782 [Tanacetum coccineum]
MDNSNDESDNDGDAYIEILLVTLISPAAMIPSSRNQGKSSATHGIMVDDVVASSASASRPRPSSGYVPTFRDVSRYAIHAEFFPFSVGPHYATYPEGGVAGNYEFTREE